MSKVTKLSDFKKKAEVELETEETKEEDFSFEEIMKRNQENKERLRRERLKGNKGTLRSYRIK